MMQTFFINDLIQIYMYYYSIVFYLLKGQGKTMLLQARTNPDGSTRLRLPDFKTIGT
jgi:hypothetical protein